MSTKRGFTYATPADLEIGYGQIQRLELLDEARQFPLASVLYVGATIDGRRFIAVKVPSYGTWWNDGWRGCCAACGQPFDLHGDRRRRYCTQQCRDAFLRQWHSETRYWTHYYQRRFACSPVQRICRCGAVFTSSKPSQKFCSSKCRKLDWWNRTRRIVPMADLPLEVSV